MSQSHSSHKPAFLLRPSEWALVAAIAIAIALTALVDANHSYWFQPFDSLRDIARNTALLGIFALGATVVIIAGGIDLSAGSMIALSGTVCATTMLALVTWLLLTRTVLGRHIHALGGNEQAARLAGIRTDNVKWFAYCFGAMTAALAGLFYMANESVAAPVNQGRGHELNAIAAAVVGGCSLAGGVGTVPGTVLGTIFLRVVIDAVSKIIKTGADVYEGLIVGIVVVIAVTLAQVGQFAKGGRGLLPGALGLCAIPTLAVLCGAIVSMTAGGRFGIAAGVGAAIFLSLLRTWESRRSA